MAHSCSPSTREVEEAEAGRIQVQGQTGLWSETLPQKPERVRRVIPQNIFYLILSINYLEKKM